MPSFPRPFKIIQYHLSLCLSQIPWYLVWQNSNLKYMGHELKLRQFHIGLIIFPHVMILRIIGRIAFPIFAFFIAEGCKHTKNKLRSIIPTNPVIINSFSSVNNQTMFNFTWLSQKCPFTLGYCEEDSTWSPQNTSSP